MRRWIGKLKFKSRSLTADLVSKLLVLSSKEGSGIPSVAVECVDIRRNTSGEGLSGSILTLRHESVGSKQD